MREIALIKAGWRDPVEVAGAGADAPWALAFLSDGSTDRARWSYVLADPAATLQLWPDDPRDPFEVLRELMGPAAPTDPDGPPFQGGLAGLLGYELGARLEAVGHPAHPDWPLIACALYDSLLAFDHELKQVTAVGRGADPQAARRRAEAALQRLQASPKRPEPDPERPLTPQFESLTPGATYEAAVAAVVERIAAGEIFQANAARAWGGELVRGVQPFDLIERLWRTSPAPFAAYFRLPGRAVVSNSPERFVYVSNDGALEVETRPIKGTRPRGRDPVEDELLKAELIACEKDRAENLMIVDLMRNDLSRVCPPGAVGVTELFAIETFANVHHLVSTVTGRLAPGLTAIDLLEAAFPPGSITGAPKIQAIKVIADYEGPRGPYCGSMFWAGLNGGCDSSVLIRTVGFVETAGGWRYEARAGAGLVADSDPVLERLETEAKIDALRRAFLGAKA